MSSNHQKIQMAHPDSFAFRHYAMGVVMFIIHVGVVLVLPAVSAFRSEERTWAHFPITQG